MVENGVCSQSVTSNLCPHSARVLDFHQPTGPGDTHPRLFDWVKQYFSQTATRGARLPPRVVQTTQPPLYLQHQGSLNMGLVDWMD